MCILSAVPAGVPVTNELMAEIARGARSNNDGHGFAIVNNAATELIVYRSMNADDMMEEFEKARLVHWKNPAITHSRWATHGETSIRGCHPFEVGVNDSRGNMIGTDPKTVLAHNGILPASTWPNTIDFRSDTRIFAEQFMPGWGMKLDSPRFYDHVERFIGGNKIAVLTVNPKYARNAYVWGVELGDVSPDSGAWWSNSGWKARTVAHWDYRTGGPSTYRMNTVSGMPEPVTLGPKARTTAPRALGQRLLTEADVLAAHGYEVVSVDDWSGDPTDSGVACATCGSLNYDVQYLLCAECGTCGECNMQIMDDSCDCYVPQERLTEFKYGAEFSHAGGRYAL